MNSWFITVLSEVLKPQTAIEAVVIRLTTEAIQEAITDGGAQLESIVSSVDSRPSLGNH